MYGLEALKKTNKHPIQKSCLFSRIAAKIRTSPKLARNILVVRFKWSGTSELRLKCLRRVGIAALLFSHRMSLYCLISCFCSHNIWLATSAFSCRILFLKYNCVQLIPKLRVGNMAIYLIVTTDDSDTVNDEFSVLARMIFNFFYTSYSYYKSERLFECLYVWMFVAQTRLNAILYPYFYF